MRIHQRSVKSEVDLEHCKLWKSTKTVLCDLHFRKCNRTRYSENLFHHETPNAR